MKDERIQIVYKRVDELREYENNPRNNDNAVDAVAASIKLAGFKVPMVIDAAGVIVAGHTRLKAAKKLGMTEVPCIIADDLTDDQIRAFRLADNKVSELADWDFSKLDEELMSLADTEIDMSVFGFEDFDIEEPQEVEEDEAPEVDEDAEPITQTGDIWQLGRHRLMCGDSTDPLNIKLLMQGKKADLVFTDPPYGVGFESVGVANDNQNEKELIDFNRQWLGVMFDHLKENGSFYIWGTERSLLNIYAFILYDEEQKEKIVMKSLITWDKGVGQYQTCESMRRYPVASEKCLFYMCGKETTSSDECRGFEKGLSTWFEGFERFRSYFEQETKRAGLSRSDVVKITNTSASHYYSKSQFHFPTEEHYKAIQDYCRDMGIDAFSWAYEDMRAEYEKQRNSKEYLAILDKQASIRKEWYDTRAYFDNTHDNMNDVWHFNSPKGEEREEAGGHATPKPIALCSRAIKSSSREGEAVLDFFGGSGSTLIACEQLNRSAYLMELEPKWCDVIIRRWENLTGEKAQKL